MTGISAEIGWRSTIAPNGMIGPLKWFSKSSLVRCSSICQEVLNMSQIAVAFHGIGLPFVFIQARLQQIHRCSFLFFPHTAISAIPFVSDRWRVEVRWIRDKFSQYFPNSNELPVWMTFFLSDRLEKLSLTFPLLENFFVLRGYDCIHWVAKSCTTIEYQWLCLDSLTSFRTLWLCPLSNHSTTFGPPDVPLSAGSTLPVFGVNSDEVSVWELSLRQEHFPHNGSVWRQQQWCRPGARLFFYLSVTAVVNSVS